MNDTNEVGNTNNQPANQPPQPQPNPAPAQQPAPVSPPQAQPVETTPQPQQVTSSTQAPTPTAQPEPASTPEVHVGQIGQEPEKEPKKKKEKLSFRKKLAQHSGLISLLQLIGGPILLVVIINAFVFQPYQVFGSSMSPTLAEGDRLIINKLGKSWANFIRGDHVPKRGDIIIFQSELKNEIQLIKRVIGLPGERVVVDNGIITVFNDENPGGFNPDKAYEDTLPDVRTGNQEIRLAEDEIFVSGDNRAPGGSLDSRNDLGPVKLDNIVGELVFRMFPLDDAQVY